MWITGISIQTWKNENQSCPRDLFRVYIMIKNSFPEMNSAAKNATPSFVEIKKIDIFWDPWKNENRAQSCPRDLKKIDNFGDPLKNGHNLATYSRCPIPRKSSRSVKCYQKRLNQNPRQGHSCYNSHDFFGKSNVGLYSKNSY